MSAMYPDGRPASLAMADRRRPRGRRLSKAQCRRLRDLWAVSMVAAGHSKADVVEVMSMGSITVDHLTERLRACPVRPPDIFAALAREADGAAQV